ncbi:MAG: phosphoglucosamine mutase [Bacteroidota bacterium]|nr:phosphoglucosamine mutase [Bacteroidota bacterium]
MTLIKSISGIRGTIGGEPGKGLTSPDIIRFTSGYAAWLLNRSENSRKTVVVGRDARVSGEMVSFLVTGTLISMGFDVIDLGLSTTPSTEMAVIGHKASGGIIITASHNPAHWNALKLLNSNGEFLSAADGDEVLKLADDEHLSFAEYNHIGKYSKDPSSIEEHIKKVLELPLVDKEAIRNAHFSIVVDGVNSTGGIAVPLLLKMLGVDKIDLLNCEPTGLFAHNPEPVPENLHALSERVNKINASLGIAVDPDVDRLALVNELGDPIGEEYTLVSVADYILRLKPGNTVSNLSSSQALKIVTEKAGGKYSASAVGEVNVVKMMKDMNAVIGGEGNGGVIYPELHYGRDALVGIALFLTHLAKSGKRCSELRDSYPSFYISKNKIEFSTDLDINDVLSKIILKYPSQPVNTLDGVRIEFGNEWVHLRRSNTEPIVRIIAESDLLTKAENLARKILQDFRDILKEKITE